MALILAGTSFMLLKMSIVVVLAVRLSVNNRFRHAEIRQLSNVVVGVGNLRLLLRGIVLGYLLKIKVNAVLSVQ